MNQKINLKPLRDNVIGRLIDMVGGTRQSKGGVIIIEEKFSEDSIRPRWFEVTNVGPEQRDVKVGQYVLVAHGRWSKGIDLEGSMKDEDKIFLLDNNGILGVQDEKPI